MALNQTIRGRFGATITEATIVAHRNKAFKDRVQAGDWSSVDDDEPVESPVPSWDDPQNKLNKDLLWELVGPQGGQVTDDDLRRQLSRELSNRETIWRLMQEAIAAVQSKAKTDFMTTPLAVAKAEGCTNAHGDPISLFDLMTILHMFGKNGMPNAPRPMDPITEQDFFYKDEATVAVEIRRRVDEQVAGINWEGNVAGGKEKKKPGVWNRYGFYCGCG